MSLADLKKNRKSQLDKLLGAAKEAGGSKGSGDDRFWKPTVDKAGNGYAVFRFLPQADTSALPWAQYWDHGFKGPTGRWYFEKSLSSIGSDDPVMEMNSFLWNTGRDEDKEMARERKRRLHYVSNILVLSDKACPENEGKVFLYRFGKKIFDKIMDVMQPEFEDETPMNPFDLWDGASCRLKIREVEGYRNYDKSEFDKPTVLGTDTELDAIVKQLMNLLEFTDAGMYKTYEELKKKLSDVLGPDGIPGITTSSPKLRAPAAAARKIPEIPEPEDGDDLNYDLPDKTAGADVGTEAETNLDIEEAGAGEGTPSDNDMMSFFKNLATEE